MKIHEIREMKTSEIIQKITEDEKNLLDLKFSHALKQLTNTAKLKLIRRDVAKMKTILAQREIEEKNKAKKE
ncbi:MAG: 50S ribosomal protein L29 [Ignavibacteriales bacterium]|nr:50S ribosomal protein L29 [Ignavibacteriales bacterium]